MRPGRAVFGENELPKRQCARPPRGRRFFLLQGVTRQHQYRDICDIGGLREGRNCALMTGAGAWVNGTRIQGIGRDKDEDAGRGIQERRIADPTVFHLCSPKPRL